MSAQPHARLTPEEYLEIERASEFRHEYYKGNAYLMAGGTVKHGMITHNLHRRLGNALDGRPCIVIGTDVRLRVGPDELYTYPDLMAVCGGPRYADRRQDTLLNPILVIEVLSPSTESYDRGFKSQQYRNLESLQEYAFVSQSEARIELYRRQPGGTWVLSDTVGLESACRFESIDASVPLAEIYDKVTFEEDAVGA